MLDRLKTLSKSLLMPGGSLLLPMLVVALGIHAALLAMPIPSSEMPEAEDKKNPISVNQIPTEQPTKPTPNPTKTVDGPAIAKTPTVTESTSGDSAASDASATATASSGATGYSSSSNNATSSTATKPSSATEKGSTGFASKSESPSEVPNSETSEPSAELTNDSSGSESGSESSNSSTAIATSKMTAAANLATNPFPDFPHYQPSVVDCYGLGFGESCRVVETQEMSQVTDFFKKELVAKDFAINLVKDEPNRKVFKVVKDAKTVFLNIWKGKDKVSYLLSKEVFNQSPEDMKAESSQ